ncbi:serine/threonine-protein kinase, partial [Kibdelosporangium lantanae]
MDDTDVGFLDRPDITGRLPGYQLVSQLAETAMSEVFLAVDTAHANRRVVVKVVGEDLLRQPTFRERFDRESHIALTLHHPNVVPAYAAGESDDGRLCYLVMRYVEGANLARVLHERGPLSFAETLDVVRQVAHAVDFAHQQGLVHRDIKPANILVERDTGHVYVCDFGIAKNLASRTVTILGPGTPFYAAPEQLE